MVGSVWLTRKTVPAVVDELWQALVTAIHSTA